MRTPRAGLLFAFLLAPALAHGAEHHVSPTGTAAGTGAASAPWNLATALAQPPAIRPGDTVLLHGGAYSGAFLSALTGSDGSPITVRSAPGEWAKIDGKGATEATFTVEGAWTVYRDFEITNTDPDRGGARSGGFDVRGPNVKLINLVVHDTGGNGFWSGATNAEIYGCVIFHNGYDDTDRGHGHGVYTQNATGTKTLADNVVFGGYSFGLHAYTEGGELQGFDFVGNVLFNAGVASSVSGHKDDCLVGGLKPADRISLRENLVWAIGGNTRAVQLGYSVANGSVELSDNYVIGAVNFAKPWSSVTMSGNTLCTVTGVDTAQYPANTYLTVDPAAPKVFVRPNKYEPGRAHVVVYNWLRAASVDVDVSSVVAPGARYELRNAQNVLAAPVLSGTYSGAKLAVPMTGLQPAQPIGSPGAYEPADQTGTLFNVFVLTSAEGAPPPPVDAGTVAPPDAGVAAPADAGASSRWDAAGAIPGADAARPVDASAARSDSGEAPALDAGAVAAEDAALSSADGGGTDSVPGCGCAAGGGTAPFVLGLLLVAGFPIRPRTKSG